MIDKQLFSYFVENAVDAEKERIYSETKNRLNATRLSKESITKCLEELKTVLYDS
jgi:hypothetical protein